MSQLIILFYSVGILDLPKPDKAIQSPFLFLPDHTKASRSTVIVFTKSGEYVSKKFLINVIKYR